MKFTFPLKTRGVGNCRLASREALPLSILPIVLKGTHCFQTFAWLPHSQIWAIIEGRLTCLILITVFSLFRSKGHREPRDKVGS